MNKFSAPSIIVMLIMASPLFAKPITFGPVKGKPGESIRLVTHSESKDGTIVQRVDGEPSSGKIKIIRKRELHWTFREPEADGSRRGMVRVVRLSSSKSVNIDGQEKKSEDISPLTGKLFAMTKTPSGEWEFKLDGSFPLSKTRSDIEELKVYLKRKWFPDHAVNPGDSWEFDPTWVKMNIERDLGKALTIGTMTLRQVRRSANRSMTVIGVSIRSTGEGFRKDGKLAEGTVDLKGELVVNLDTMLDESLELEGTVTSNSQMVGDSKKVVLPVRMVATKTLFKGGGIP